MPDLDVANNSDAKRGARGLGWHMAEAFLEAGVGAIALLDRKKDLGDLAAAQLQNSTSIPVKFYAVDVTDEDMVKATVDTVYRDLSSIDIVVNSAGIVE